MRLKRLNKDERGATIVEFALVSPLLFFLALGVVELGLIYSAQNLLESATYIASRSGKTGFSDADNGMTRDETIAHLLEGRSSILMDPALISISSKSYPDFDLIGASDNFTDLDGDGVFDPAVDHFDAANDDLNGNGTWDEDIGLETRGSGGEVIVYSVTYPWPIFTPIFRNILGTGGVITLGATAIVKNEPF